MRIVIDLQGAQAENQSNDIDRYSLDITKAIIQNSGDHEISIVLSDLFPDTIDPIRTAMQGVLPTENIHIYHSSFLDIKDDIDNSPWQEITTLIQDAFITSLSPDIVYVTNTTDDIRTTDNNLFTQYLCKIYSKQCAREQNTSIKSPDEEAVHLLKTFEEAQKKFNCHAKKATSSKKPKLAFISPLPPIRSGVSDYSATLLPDLSHYYDIDIILDQDDLTDTWIKKNCNLHSTAWFTLNSHRFDRVLYHIGNSAHHLNALNLLEKIPGVVVLHDCFLSDLLTHKGHVEFSPHSEQRHDTPLLHALHHSHGYQAIKKYFEANAQNKQPEKPCSLAVLQQAFGTIIHSQHTAELAKQYYNCKPADNLAVIPLARTNIQTLEKNVAKKKLGLPEDSFLICSFGFLTPTKLNHRILEAFLNSQLSQTPNIYLILAGHNNADDYGSSLLSIIEKSKLGKRLQITGWLDNTSYHHYLSATDIAVQLRTDSHGETSAAALDCLYYGVPTIVNSHGPMAELPKNSVYMLKDNFSNTDLTNALENLCENAARRLALGKQAQEIIRSKHNPKHCAKLYFHSIEKFYRANSRPLAELIKAIGLFENLHMDNKQIMLLSTCLAKNFPTKPRPKQLLVDVSEICLNDLKTGIQRVVRALLVELIKNPPKDYHIAPVYFSDAGGYWRLKHAQKKTLEIIGCPTNWCKDEVVDVQAGDLFLGLDFSAGYIIECQELLTNLNKKGVSLFFVIYDLLPLIISSKFPKHMADSHTKWLSIISQFNGVLCISKTVSDDFYQWNTKQHIKKREGLKIDWFHLGADINSSAPTKGLPHESARTLSSIEKHPTFLMIGTIEPRKGHHQTLSACEILWERGININLVIVGKQGWNTERINKKLEQHSNLNKHVFFLDGISDEYLEKVYAASTCLIAASEAEGFGLPLIEAAKHKLPIIARDIPVFREVAGEHAFYFSGEKPSDLAMAINDWLTLHSKNIHPKSNDMPWLTWHESANQLKERLLRIHEGN